MQPAQPDWPDLAAVAGCYALFDGRLRLSGISFHLFDFAYHAVQLVSDMCQLFCLYVVDPRATL